ncbi:MULTISPECIES: nucleotide-binding protein [Methanoculleus]|uniref:Nucleic acid binding, OB-fold, tRNA/helicase-type n=2 Tax=Methanoculleus TaxID=45989 RepID=A3CWU3_METMJ|nr:MULTISPECIES: nucleotide-binding protein [Methanoculleus]ABN57843.1 nucleic acid binding, OB-fold, tRNA/helicase-type [Methanoculleus marisnigri JR1]MCC7555130.1 nucleotide-binding protein [Methanoculleus marisnigri]UYU19229.1 nucleotide-binding protein [Methanoculleus submarinus]
MKFHYLLVDDLLEKGEFERRVEGKVAESGDLLDERTAAMLVVKDLGRSHIRIRDLAAAPSLACFFAKVLAVEEPREFERPDGTPGLVANVTVGDETGRARLTLWDEKAAGVSEIEAGDVLEILGRPKGKGKVPDVTAVAVQEAACEISCDEGRDASAPGPAGDLEVRLISIESPRAFVRRDGTPGEMVEAVIGNEDGVFRLVAWAPAVLLGVEPGENVVIRGAVARENDRGVEYSLGESASVVHSDGEIDLPMNTVAGIEEGGTYSLAGTVLSVQPPHSFTTRNGRQSSVRNLVIADPTGEIPVVVWGEKADEHLVPGDRIEVYNATARRGRYGDLEVHLSWGSALVLLAQEEKEVEVEGTIIATREGIALDTGDACYLLDEPLPIGSRVRARGRVHRGVICLSDIEAVMPDQKDLQRRLDRFAEEPRS